MNDQSRALVHAVTGPIILITVGSLFALEKFSGYPFRQTWPVLIIAIGLLKLFGGSRRRRFRTDGTRSDGTRLDGTTGPIQPGSQTVDRSTGPLPIRTNSRPATRIKARSPAMNRHSVTGPVILVCAGLLLLLHNLTPEIAIQTLIRKDWPFVVILVGVAGLVEVLYHASRGNPIPPRPISSLVWMVVVFSAFGLWGYHARGIQFGPSRNRWHQLARNQLRV